MAARELLLLDESDPLVQARNEASVIVFEGLSQYVTDVEPVFEGETAKYYGWAAGHHCGHPKAFKDESFCTLCGLCYHGRVMRENPGAWNEVQWCEFCGEERTRVWREGVDGRTVYRGF